MFEYSFWEIISLSGHLTYPDTGTVQDQFEVQKVRSRVSIYYLELGSLYMLNSFLTTCNSRRKPRICKFKESRCQHESIDIIVETVIIEQFVVKHKPRNFCLQLLFNRHQNFRLRSHDKLINYIYIYYSK